jgi:hypothetical protein
VSTISNGYKSGISLSAVTPSITIESAIAAAMATLQIDSSKIYKAPEWELVVHVDGEGASRLAWLVRLVCGAPHGARQMIIDASIGSVISSEDMATGYSDGNGIVFKPDPVTALNNSSLNDQADANYEALWPAYQSVVLKDLDDPLAGAVTIKGRYARSEQIEPDGSDGTHLRHPVAQSNYYTFNFYRDHAGFEEVTAYYYIDLLRRYIGGLGFNPRWRDVNSQWTDAIRFDAHGLIGYSHFVPQSGGAYIAFSDRLTDDAEDLSVVIHEYSHAVHDALSAEETPGLGSPHSVGRSMTEGTADYLAVSYRRALSSNMSNRVFPWDLNDEDLATINPVPPREISDRKFELWNSSENPYYNAMIWSGTMMDLQTDPIWGIGRDETTTLLLNTLMYTDPTLPLGAATPIEYMQAMFQSDFEIYGGLHFKSLGKIFFGRHWFNAHNIYNWDGYLASGDISTSTEWGPFRWVNGQVTVKAGATLTIGAGAIVFIEDGQRIYVENGGSIDIHPTATIVAYGHGPTILTQDGTFVLSSQGPDWNMVSVPNLVPNFASTAVYPTALSGASRLNLATGGYVIEPTLSNGIGYWLRFGSEDENVKYAGSAVTSVTVAVKSDWNLIGSLSTELPIEKIQPVGTTFYQPVYYFDGSYHPSTVLQPGRAYWVKTTTAGSLILNASSVFYAVPPSTVAQPPAPPSLSAPMAPVLACTNCATPLAHPSFNWNAVSGSNITYKLYRYNCFYGEGDCEEAAGVVYSGSGTSFTDNAVTVFKKTGQVLTPNSTYFYYVKAVDGFAQSSTASNKKTVNSGDFGGETETVHRQIGDEAFEPMPTETTLFGSYPNPFNPTTNIRYGLVDVASVSLKVYNTFGQEIANLVDEVQSAGFHEVTFDGSRLSSGIYFYKFQAGNYSAVKKLMLLK